MKKSIAFLLAVIAALNIQAQVDSVIVHTDEDCIIRQYLIWEYENLSRDTIAIMHELLNDERGLPFGDRVAIPLDLVGQEYATAEYTLVTFERPSDGKVARVFLHTNVQEAEEVRLKESDFNSSRVPLKNILVF